MRALAARLLFAGLLVVPGIAAAGTCTVSSMRVTVGNFGLDGTLPIQGMVLPVTVDAAAGTFALDLSNFPHTSFTIVGVESELSFSATGAFVGTIDRSGNVVVPGVAMRFSVKLGDPPILVEAQPTLTTGVHATTVSGKDYPTSGTPLDFTTGELHLEGEDVIPDAPNAGGPVTSGIALRCVLDPIPDPSSLPAAPALKHATGKVKLGAALMPDDTTVQPDSFALNAVFAQGPTAVDPATADLFVRVRDGAGQDVALLRVPAGNLVAKKKTLHVTDTDGSLLHVVTGRKKNSHVLAALGGSVLVKKTKTTLKLTVKESALDLSTLTAGAGSVTIGVGSASATRAIAVKVKGSKVTFK